MNRDYLKKTGLLEQYVLGLTNRKETLLVQKTLENDPEARQDYERLQEELGEYLNTYGIEASQSEAENRPPEYFEELEHEVALKLTQENRSLKRWRWGLGLACLCLLTGTIYSFRQSNHYHTALVTEKAQHAQDQHSFGIELEHLHDEAVDLTKLTTEEVPAKNGLILLHHLKEHNLALLDLSHIEPLGEEHAYFIFLEGKLRTKPCLVLKQDELHHLHALKLGHGVDTLKIFRWAADAHPPKHRPAEDLIAGLALR